MHIYINMYVHTYVYIYIHVYIYALECYKHMYVCMYMYVLYVYVLYVCISLAYILFWVSCWKRVVLHSSAFFSLLSECGPSFGPVCCQSQLLQHQQAATPQLVEEAGITVWDHLNYGEAGCNTYEAKSLASPKSFATLGCHHLHSSLPKLALPSRSHWEHAF